MSEFDPFHELSVRVASLEARLARCATSEDVAAMREEFGEMLSAFRAAKGAIQVLELVGKLARPIAWIAALSAAWTIWWSGAKHSIDQFFNQ